MFRQVVAIRWAVYVAHPLHQRYIHEHASKVIGERVIVQHDWTPSID